VGVGAVVGVAVGVEVGADVGVGVLVGFGLAVGVGVLVGVGSTVGVGAEVGSSSVAAARTLPSLLSELPEKKLNTPKALNEKVMTTIRRTIGRFSRM